MFKIDPRLFQETLKGYKVSDVSRKFRLCGPRMVRVLHADVLN